MASSDLVEGQRKIKIKKNVFTTSR